MSTTTHELNNREIIKIVGLMGKIHIIIYMFLHSYHPIIYSTVHEINMQYSMVNPIDNIESNALLNCFDK